MIYMYWFMSRYIYIYIYSIYIIFTYIIYNVKCFAYSCPWKIPFLKSSTLLNVKLWNLVKDLKCVTCNFVEILWHNGPHLFGYISLNIAYNYIGPALSSLYRGDMWIIVSKHEWFSEDKYSMSTGYWNWRQPLSTLPVVCYCSMLKQPLLTGVLVIINHRFTA